MKYPVYNQTGEKVGEALLPKEIFEVKLNSDLLHQVVTSQAANQRQGNAHTKTRGEVRGGGKKPWRQKGTGRARVSSIRSPLWRGGGTVFGPRNEKNYDRKINKKMGRLALFMALSGKARDGELVVLDSFKLIEAKTKPAVQILDNLKSKIEGLKRGRILFVLANPDPVIIRATGNIAGFETDQARNLNALQVLSCKNLFLTKDVIPVLKKTFLKKSAEEE